MFSLDEDGQAVFRIFPGYEMFPDYLELVKEEANYWKGYGPYLEKAIRENGQYEDLDEGLELVKKATNLRQSIYNDVKLWKGADAGSQKEKDLEIRMVLKSYEVAKLRVEFTEYLRLAEIPLRLKYSKKPKEESENDLQG